MTAGIQKEGKDTVVYLTEDFQISKQDSDSVYKKVFHEDGSMKLFNLKPVLQEEQD